MFSVMRITSIEYYEAQDRTAQAEAGEDRNAGRDEMAYYTDNGQGESGGVWWTRTSSEPLSSLFPHPFGTNGEAVNGRHLRDLAAGRDPETGDILVKGAGNGKRSVGFDLTMSAPKTASMMAAFGGEDTRRIVFDGHDRAMAKMLDAAFDMGLVVGRHTPKDPLTGKKTEVEVPVVGASAAVYRHFSSRAKDPQLHSHAVLMNLGVRPDGTTGALDNRRLMLYGGALAAIYRAELASILKQELGVELVRKGRNFEIAGIPEEVVQTFSKRRAEIEAAMDGKSTEANRKASQIASYETRAEKDREMTLEELEQRWNRELQAAGWTGEALVQSARYEAERIRKEAGEQDRTAKLDGLVLKALAEMTEHNAVIDDRLLLRDAIEAVQTECGADESLATIERLKASGELVQIGMDQGRAVYSTREIIEAEKAMLRTAKARQGERDFVSVEAIERAIRKRDTIRDEQAEAVRHALNRDGISIVEGAAGSGKSFSLGAVADVARDCGLDVWTLAPSHKAKEVVRVDTQTADEYAKAVQGFVNRLGKPANKGGITLNPGSVVIVDEAGMVGTADMAKLVEATERARCKLVLVGDTRQLQAVVAGAPMRAMTRILGSSRMKEITRQADDWQKAASMDFAEGQAVRAFEAYDKAGRVKIGDDREQTIAQLVRDYAASRKVPAFLQTHDNGRPVTRAILTSWNVDVREINERVREAGREAGWITGDDWTLPVYPRGVSTPSKLNFATGDDIIFGETVENVAGRTLYNADLARIVSIEGDPKDPLLTLQLAKDKRGETIRVRASELVGKREEGEAAIPRMQHAAAMTVHASQGVTVDHAYVANIRGMGQETSYVAMTRHRQSVSVYADASRIVDQIAATGGKAIRQHQGGKTVMPEEGDTASVAVTMSEIKKRLFQEATRADQKRNASDFMNLKEILGETVEPVAETVTRDAARLPETPAETVRPQVEPATPPRPIPSSPFKLDLSSRPSGTVGSQADALRDRIAERETAKTRYPVPKKPSPPPFQKITPDEFDKFRQADLISFAKARLEGTLVEEWKNGNSAAFRFGKEGKKVAISRLANGDHVWTVSSDPSTKGDIVKLVQYVKSCTWKEAAHWLRDELRTFDPSSVAESREREKPAPAEKGDFTEGRKKWQQFQVGVSRWLTEERGIRKDIVLRFASDIKPDWNLPKSHNRHGAVFAHRTPDGELVSYQRRGYPKPGKEKSFRQNAPGGSPTLFMAGSMKPSTIYVTESAIDTLSLYQHDGGPADAMLLSPDGAPGRRALEAIAEIARRNPDAEWNVALDVDKSGALFEEQVRAAIRRGHAEATIRERPPEEGFKDWNGQIRGLTATQEAEAKTARIQAENEQADRAKRDAKAQRMAEEEARRQAAEAAQASSPRYVPRR